MTQSLVGFTTEVIVNSTKTNRYIKYGSSRERHCLVHPGSGPAFDIPAVPVQNRLLLLGLTSDQIIK